MFDKSYNKQIVWIYCGYPSTFADPGYFSFHYKGSPLSLNHLKKYTLLFNFKEDYSTNYSKPIKIGNCCDKCVKIMFNSHIIDPVHILNVTGCIRQSLNHSKNCTKCEKYIDMTLDCNYHIIDNNTRKIVEEHILRNSIVTIRTFGESIHVPNSIRLKRILIKKEKYQYPDYHASIYDKNRLCDF